MGKTIYIDYRNSTYWLSYEWFLNHGITENTYSSWCQRKVCEVRYVDNKAYINYDSIPERTRAKLPTKAEIRKEQSEAYTKETENTFIELLEAAKTDIRNGHWRNEIKAAYPALKWEKVVEFSRRATVFEEVLRIDSLIRQNGREHGALFRAFNHIFPEKGYTYSSRFHMAMKKAKEQGIISIAVDTRALRNDGSPYKEDYRGIAMAILGDRRAFAVVDSYDMFVEACNYLKYNKIPSFGWFKSFWLENKVLICQTRMGESTWQKKYGTYAKIIPALYADDQWQMDGWTIPVYCKKPNANGGYEYFVRYNLFVVMDAHARRIVGFDMAESENTDTIMKSLEMAVKTTGALPFELVADNHSFNKTKEATNLKAATEALSMTWTVDSNPRRKAILERAFRVLGDKHFKRRYGYIGQGIRTKLENGLTQQELKDKYTKPENMLTYDQMYAIVVDVVLEYNKSIRKTLGDSPNNLYAKSEKPNSIEVDDFKRIALFNRESEHKVTHGQITIKRGMHTYEYQLPAEYSTRYNGKTVRVRYPDFNEIYLYDIETDEPICSISQKQSIHGAMANQSDNDTINLFKNSGRIKGVETRKRKKKESIFDAGSNINPDFIHAANAVTMPKDAIAKAKQDFELRSILTDKGVNVETINELPVIKTIGLERSNVKDNKSPFAVKDVEPGILNIEKMVRATNSHQ